MSGQLGKRVYRAGLLVGLGLVLDFPPVADEYPAYLAQTLVAQQSLQAEMDDLARSLRARQLDAPEYGRQALMFETAMQAPFDFPRQLAAFSNRAVPRPRPPWADHLSDLIAREWPAQYGGQSPCSLADLAPPHSLDAAADQIRQLAEATRRLQLNALDSHARNRLAGTYARFGQLLRDTVTAAMSRSERRSLKRFLARLDKASSASVRCAALTWARLGSPRWLARLRDLMAEHPRAGQAAIQRTASPLGAIVFGGHDNARMHMDNLLFLADLGGDDFYGIDSAVDFSGTPQFIVDFAGDDSYQSSRPGGYAAGMGRVAILLDVAGNDRYLAASHGQGSAILGVGALVDLAGDDRYRADSHAQGCALFGLGLLLDGAGHDSYEIRALGQGLGMANGLGFLVDGGGDDAYSAQGGAPTNYHTPGLTDVWAQGAARGIRGLAPGGIGLLADAGGVDRYDAGSFAQGGAYYRGVGQLLDYGDDDDELLGSRYNAGWGAHGGVGRFVNEGGDDRYDTRHMVAGGLAWDYSLALFQDGGGNDFYRLGGLSLGAAAHGSAAWFLDTGGNDEYASAPKLAQWDRGPPNFALFLDQGGQRNLLNGQSQGASCRLSDQQGFVLWLADDELPVCRKEAP